MPDFDLPGDVSPLVPFVVALFLTALMAPAGVSGAFLLLPFQFSVLGFTGPGVTPTNHLFNVVAIPSGVYRYVREGRMLWPLAIVIAIGTVPGVVAGSFVRLYLLPDPRNFRLLIGFVLLLIGANLVRKVLSRRKSSPGNGDMRVAVTRFDWRRLEYTWQGETHGVSSIGLSVLTLVIGVIGGAYGVGGGAIISPILVAVYHLPVHTIAGATLFGTCLTSFVAVGFFAAAGPVLGIPQASPHWALGLLFGAGGMLGLYCGARIQKRMPARLIEVILAVAVNFLAVTYVVGFFRR